MRKFGIIAILLIAVIIALTGCTAKQENSSKEKIITSFYPIYIMTLNIVDGIPEIEVSNMTDSNIGCIHNYTLQTADLKKLENANVFVRNGLGLEVFMDKIVTTYPSLKTIDTSKAELNLIEDEEETNGHVWTSIENYKKQVNYIAQELANIYPEHKEKLVDNAEAYISKINQIEAYKAETNMNVISCNEELSYILKEANLQVIPVYTDHDESALSSGNIAEVVNEAKKHNVKIIFIDKDDDEKNANILANEIGAKIVRLDSASSGESNKDAYIKTMQYNFNTLRDSFAN